MLPLEFGFAWQRNHGPLLSNRTRNCSPGTNSESSTGQSCCCSGGSCDCGTMLPVLVSIPAGQNPMPLLVQKQALEPVPAPAKGGGISDRYICVTWRTGQ